MSRIRNCKKTGSFSQGLPAEKKALFIENNDLKCKCCGAAVTEKMIFAVFVSVMKRKNYGQQ